MNGSDKVNLNINIGGEILKVSVDYNQQDLVRKAEAEVKKYYDKLRKNWPDASEKKILAIAAYQFAFWYEELFNLHDEAIGVAQSNSDLIDKTLNPDTH